MLFLVKYFAIKCDSMLKTKGLDHRSYCFSTIFSFMFFFNKFRFVNDIVGYCFLMIMFIVLNCIWIVDGLGLN